MNWYKLAQIWIPEKPRNGDFLNNLENIYELEYKYSFIHSNPNIFPKRRDNIIRNIEENFRESLGAVVEPMIKTFEEWLKEHALLDADAWAKKRVESDKEREDSEEYIIYNIEHDFYGYEERKKNGQNIYDIISFALQEYENMPNLKKLFECIGEEYIEGMEEDYNEEEIEQMKEEVKNPYFILEFVEDTYTPGKIHSRYYVSPDKRKNIGFTNLLDNNYCESNKDGIFYEIYRYGAFPKWIERWKPRGIFETRKKIESAYNELKTVYNMPMKFAVAAINIALNIQHQTGSMLDYLSEVANIPLEEYLKNLSDDAKGKALEWAKQINEIEAIQNEKTAQKMYERSPIIYLDIGHRGLKEKNVFLWVYKDGIFRYKNWNEFSEAEEDDVGHHLLEEMEYGDPDFAGRCDRKNHICSIACRKTGAIRKNVPIELIDKLQRMAGDNTEFYLYD